MMNAGDEVAATISGANAAFAGLTERALGDELGGEWRLVPTWVNRLPTAASYLRRPGDTEFRAFKFDVLRIRDGLVSEITTFGPELFPAFGLPSSCDPRAAAQTRPVARLRERGRPSAVVAALTGEVLRTEFR